MFAANADHEFQVSAYFSDGKSAQTIVGPKCQNDDFRLVFHQPADAPHPTRRCVATHPGVDHLVGKPGRGHLQLQSGRIAFFLFHAKSCCQTISQR